MYSDWLPKYKCHEINQSCIKLNRYNLSTLILIWNIGFIVCNHAKVCTSWFQNCHTTSRKKIHQNYIIIIHCEIGIVNLMLGTPCIRIETVLEVDQIKSACGLFHTRSDTIHLFYFCFEFWLFLIPFWQMGPISSSQQLHCVCCKLRPQKEEGTSYKIKTGLLCWRKLVLFSDIFHREWEMGILNIDHYSADWWSF